MFFKYLTFCLDKRLDRIIDLNLVIRHQLSLLSNFIGLITSFNRTRDQFQMSP